VRYTGEVLVAGRRRELDQIGRLLDRAEIGAGGVLVVVGPAGSGKTALVEAAAAASSMCCRPRRLRVSRDAWCGRSYCAIRERRTGWRPTW
jgi:chromosomal replication initiation ATPase DnaA